MSGADRYSSQYGSLLQWNSDTRGHGTHITGTVSAIAGNNFGIRGMGKIPVYVTRGLDNNGQARESDIVDAMEQCDSAGAKVISLSLAGSAMSTPIQNIIDHLYDNNVMVVAAAGNMVMSYEAYPASYNKVVSVGAVDENEVKWEDSNNGP